MKRVTLVHIGILLLLFSSIYGTTLYAKESNKEPYYNNSLTKSIDVNQAIEGDDSYRPIFLNITTTNVDDNQLIRERNETIGNGAIYQVTPRINVTIFYAIALKNTTSFVDNNDFKLFADVPWVNTTQFNNTGLSTPLSLTDATKTISMAYTNTNRTDFVNYTLPYDNNKFLANATLYYFKTTINLNMSVDYIPFYVATDTGSQLNEIADDNPYNLLSSKANYNTSSEDEFYVQNEKLNITGSIFFADSNVKGFGIKYKFNNTGDFKYKNFTMIFTGNESGTINFDTYNPDTVFSWESVLYFNDTQINLTRSIENVESKIVTFGDGTPKVESVISQNHPKALIIENKIYSQNFTITFNVIASVAKGNISNIELYPSIGENPIQFDKVNNTFEDNSLNLTVNYLNILGDQSATSGNFTATIYTLTDKNLSSNTTFIVTIDKENPVANLDDSIIPETGVFVSFNHEVTFLFSSSDSFSGVRIMYLDLGDNSSVEVTGLDSYTHKYRNVKDGQFFIVQLVVIDFAGNEASSTIVITLENETFEQTRVRGIGFLIFSLFLIALVTSRYWAPRIYDRFS